MTRQDSYDAVVVGSGPNGLAAAITLARQGCSVLLLEAKETIGGGLRTQELTLPGFRHDVCSAIHPLGKSSPFFRTLELENLGVEWIHPPVAVAHPLDDGSAVALSQEMHATMESIGADGNRWQRLMAPLVTQWEKLLPTLLGPAAVPHHPLSLLKFGLRAPWPATMFARMWFREERAAALLAGLSAHSMLRLDAPLSTAFGLVLGMMGHAVGWPLPRGGSQVIADTMSIHLHSLGGEIVTDHPVTSMEDIPPARAILFDLTPRQLLQIAGDRLPASYRRQLERYRYGMGVCKIDYALTGAVPWQASPCHRAGTVHLGGTMAEIAQSERQIARGEHPESPYVLVAQQSRFDPGRAPAGQHTLWAYCHVPNGSTQDMSDRVEAQIERFAPGFREQILGKSVRTASAMERYNANYIGGDINGGIQDWRQLWTRPVPRWNPYRTPLEHIYLCSSATPPGGGVHGMCGYHAARIALRDLGLVGQEFA